jgi:hypothetical protein
MTVAIPIPMSQEEQASLLAQAKAQGLSVDALLRRAVLDVIAGARDIAPRQQLSPEEFERAFEEIADIIPESVPSIPDDALSRENIYTREDEW